MFERNIDTMKKRFHEHFFIAHVTVHRQAILLLVVESGTRKFRCLSVECLFVESGIYDVICQFCTVKGMVVESEILKAQSCALSNKACLCTLMHSYNFRFHVEIQNHLLNVFHRNASENNH